MKSNLKLIAIISLTLSSSAFASTYTWNLAGPSSELLGNTENVLSTTGNISLAFAGFITNTTDVGGTSATWSAPTAKATALYSKNEGGDEIGLGIAADPTHDDEIFPNSFVQINLTDLLAQKSISSLSLVIGSVQSGEGFSIWGSNTAGDPGSLLYTGNSSKDDVAFNVPSYGTYKYVTVSATANNVLLDTVTATTACMTATPEPGTLALGFIAGIGLLAQKLAKRSAKVKA